MKTLITTIAVLIGTFNVTSYRSVVEQTDDSPFITSIGQRVCGHGIAVSQDMLKSRAVKYGDWVYVENVGMKQINDTMNIRHKNRFDVWVSSLKEEREFHRKFKGRKLKVWIIGNEKEVRYRESAGK